MRVATQLGGKNREPFALANSKRVNVASFACTINTNNIKLLSSKPRANESGYQFLSYFFDVESAKKKNANKLSTKNGSENSGRLLHQQQQ